MTEFMTDFLSKACINDVCHIVPKSCSLNTTISILTNNPPKINSFSLICSSEFPVLVTCTGIYIIAL